MKSTVATLKAIEALPEGTHKIAPRLYLRRADRGKTISRLVLLRWMDNGKARVKSLGQWRRDHYGHFLAEAQRVNVARQAGQDVDVILSEGAAPDTFKEAAEAYMAKNLPAFTSEKARWQFRRSMELLYPALGDLKIGQITVSHIVKVLEPDWLRIPVKIRVVRRRIELVLSSAISLGDLNIPNVAALDLVRHRLPKQPRRRVKSHQSMAHGDLPDCFTKLGEQWASTTEAMRFVILTVARSSEVRLMKWPEVDFEAKLWTCPADRMKSREPWRFPLNEPAILILRRLRELRIGNPYVFPGRKRGRPLSPNAILTAFRRLGFEDDTQHGMRSTFKDWCRETQKFEWEAVELCLAHDVQADVERVYGRSDLLHLRRPIIDAWGRFVAGKRVRVIPKKLAA